MKRKVLLLVFVIMLCSICAYASKVTERPTGDYIKVVEELSEADILNMPKENDNDNILFDVQYMKEEAGEEVSSDDYYGYNELLKESQRLSRAYKFVLNGMKNRDKYIRPLEYNLTLAEFDKVFDAVINDWPQLFYLKTGYSYGTSNGYVTVAAPYYISYLTLEEDRETFESAAERIIEESGARAEMSDYDKAVMLHDELVADIEYDYDALNLYNEAYKITNSEERKAEIARLDGLYSHIHSAYGAFVHKKAVCDGYSRAYQYLLYKMGIVSHITTGTADGGGHAWNLVRLDGKWYYTDLTWDDHGNTINFYEYFNITSSQLKEADHIINNPYELPECNSLDLNYFTVNGGKMNSKPDIDEIVRQFKDNSYARIYIAENSDLDVWQWFKDNIGEIANKVGIKGGFSYGLESSRKEYHLKLFHDTVHPVKNMGLEICSTTNKECRILIGFYDKDGKMIDMYESEVESLEANKIKHIKYKKAPAHFKYVKYFIWDKDGGLKPLYHDADMEY